MYPILTIVAGFVAMRINRKHLVLFRLVESGQFTMKREELRPCSKTNQLVGTVWEVIQSDEKPYYYQGASFTLTFTSNKEVLYEHLETIYTLQWTSVDANNARISKFSNIFSEESDWAGFELQGDGTAIFSMGSEKWCRMRRIK